MLIGSIDQLPYPEVVFIETQFVKLVEALDEEDRGRLLDGRDPAHSVNNVLQHRSRGLEALFKALWVDYVLTGVGSARREIVVRPQPNGDTHYSCTTYMEASRVPLRVMERMQVEQTVMVRLRPFG